MQKLASRAAQAQKQAAKRQAISIKKMNRDTRRQVDAEITAANREIITNLSNARRDRREAWELGPLAPKRDLGFNGYGAAKQFTRVNGSVRDTRTWLPQVVERRCAWAGGVKMLSLAPGDRVVILQGPEKGKIDTIKQVQRESGTVVLTKYHSVRRVFCLPFQNQLSLLIPNSALHAERFHARHCRPDG